MLSVLLRCVLVFVLGLMAVAGARAQGTAEYGSASAAKSAATTAAAKPPKPSVEAPSPALSGAGHLPIQDSEKVAAANRRAFEELGGSDAAKVSLGSVPVQAQVWMDGKFVGTAPLELTLAPGPHRVEMRSAGMEWARRDLRLLPKQTQQVVLSLKPRYSRNITLR
jgi:hypothetical protein